jgi:thioredoxin reductase
VYLGKGIYAEVTLYYRKGTFRAHEFTYRDYRTKEYIEIFEMMRNSLKGLITST